MEIRRQVPLADRTTLGVGGPAAALVVADDEATVIEALSWAERQGMPVRILGGGSNVVVADEGVDGLVIEIAIRGTEIDRDGDAALVSAAAGEPWDALVALAVSQNLAGIECLSGIPGRVGATPIQNVGAYGQDVSETLFAVRAWDRKLREIVTLSAKDCGFAYRDSVFKSGEPERWVVLGVSYRLRPGGAPSVRYPDLMRALDAAGDSTLADVREAVLRVRKTKSMLIEAGDPNCRSCGSFFVNPIVAPSELEAVERRVADPSMPKYPERDGRTKLSAAWLIERAGLSRGQRAGNVGLSSKHTLAIVCHDGARASEVIAFARRVRDQVRERFGVTLVLEPQLWGLGKL